jgi:4-diphosphocytidyl-2C-methyl-D-erythritol kinase
VVIAAPELVVRSGEAYGWWDLDTAAQGQARAAGQPPASRCAVAVESMEQLRPLTANGLRPVVARRVPLVEDLVRALIQCGALAAEMTGSGPAVFGLYETEGAAARAAAALRSAFPGVLVMLSAADPTRLDPRSLAPAAPRPGTAAARSRPGAREERLGGREN